MKLLAIPGSLRAGSFNRKLLALGVAELKARGVEVDLYDLKTAALPIYDGDLEAAGMPEAVVSLKQRIAAADALLICTPEYNHNLPAGLKNAIDWASRALPKVDGKPHPLSQPFKGKLAGTLGATTGRNSTIYAQLALREVLNTLGVFVIPGAMTVMQADENIDADGKLKQEFHKKQLTEYLGTLVSEVKARAKTP
jgi:chromate reductase